MSEDSQSRMERFGYWRRRILNPGPKLSQRVLHAAFWSSGSRVGERVLGYLRIIVLARLLSPVDFGLMGIGLMVTAILEALIKPGFTEALIQKKGRIDDYLDILWTAGIYRALIIAVFLIAAAPLVATFFKASDARPIIQVIGVAVLIRGLINPGILYFDKDLEFQKKTLNSLVPAGVEMLAAIAAAIVLRNVWALVIGFLAGNMAQVAISYLSHPYRPRFSHRMGQARELFAFGRWVYLDRIVTLLSTQADSLLLAKLLGPVQLGFYQMAQRTSRVPLLELSRSVSVVAFPVYSKIQDDIAKLRRAFLHTVEMIFGLALPLTVTIVLLARDFVILVLGDKWLPSVPAMQILAVAALMSSLGGAGAPLFMGSGKPWLSFRIDVTKAIALAVAIYPLTSLFGLTGAAYAVLIASGVTLMFSLFLSISMLNLRFVDIARVLLPSSGVTAVIVLVIMGAKRFLEPVDVPGFISVAILVLSTYAGLYLLMWWKLKLGLFSTLMAMKK